MAKQFNFSLQKVLDVRQHLEELQAVQVLKSKERLKSEEQKLDSLRCEKQRAMSDEESQGGSRKFNLNQLKVAGQYLIQLNRQIEQQDKKVADSGRLVKQEVIKLNDAVKNRKVVEKLKERHLEEHKKEINQEYNKQQDEVATRVVKSSH